VERGARAIGGHQQGARRAPVPHPAATAPHVKGTPLLRLPCSLRATSHLWHFLPCHVTCQTLEQKVAALHGKQRARREKHEGKRQGATALPHALSAWFDRMAWPHALTACLDQLLGQALRRPTTQCSSPRCARKEASKREVSKRDASKLDASKKDASSEEMGRARMRARKGRASGVVTTTLRRYAAHGGSGERCRDV